jgi:hypothetical protein
MMFTQEGMAQMDAALAATQTARKQRMTVLQWPQPPEICDIGIRDVAPHVSS